MAQIIMGHGVSWCFGTSLAPNLLSSRVQQSSLIRFNVGSEPRGNFTSRYRLYIARVHAAIQQTIDLVRPGVRCSVFQP
jgi:hypothetical protein